MPTFAHIINPVHADPSSDLYTAQPVTFETIRIARDHARKQGIDVRLFSAQFTEDRDMVPADFQKTPDLHRSVSDLHTFHLKRKLPILKDILDRLYHAAPGADYLIYSNVDIALMPTFYVAISQLIYKGYDAFTVTRRVISQRYTSVDELNLMYAETGRPHPGTDCFIFKRDAYPRYYLDTACIGSLYGAKSLVINMVQQAYRYRKFTGLHLSFHIGRAGAWRSERNREYTNHNRRAVRRILEYYRDGQGLKDHPVIDKALRNHWEKLWRSQHGAGTVFLYLLSKYVRLVLFRIPLVYRIRRYVRRFWRGRS